MKVIDLTMPMHSHWRWKVSLERVRTIGPESLFQISELHSNVHAFTHVDSPQHVLPEAPSLDLIPIERLAGPAAVIDLSDKGPGEPIIRGDLEKRGSHVLENDIVLLRTCWDRKYSPDSKDYWTQACYVTEGAAHWLLEHAPSAVGYDFPQDIALRSPMVHGNVGPPHPFEDYTTHSVLLTQGVLNLEYLINLHQIGNPRPYVLALPMLIRGAEAAPARVIAIEFD
jgi:arylformamidase